MTRRFVGDLRGSPPLLSKTVAVSLGWTPSFAGFAARRLARSP